MFTLGSFAIQTFLLSYTIFDGNGNPFTVLGDPGAPRTVGTPSRDDGIQFSSKALVVNYFPKFPSFRLAASTVLAALGIQG